MVMLDRLKRIFGGRLIARSSPAVAESAPARAQAGAGPVAGTAVSDMAAPAPPSPAIRSDDIDPDALKVVGRLARHGHTAFLVGGCVRDLLLGGEPKDFDISTSATPRQVKQLFRNSRIIGRRFKLAHVFFRNFGGAGEKIIEVATFRATH